MAKYEISELFDHKAEHGEGPVWDPESNRFFWVDLMQGKYQVGDWGSGRVDVHEVGQPLGVLAQIKESENLMMALRDGFFLYDPETKKLTEINPVEKDMEETRFNDGAVDLRGRFLAGTMTYDGQKPIGNVYSLRSDGSVQKIQSNTLLANGMGWNAAGDTFYFADTEHHVVYKYDYDLETGTLNNRRNFIEFGPNGFPDGLTVDDEGCLWVAMWQEGKISRFDTKGKKIVDIHLPVTHPTSCCFGGPELKHLCITTSQLPLTEEEKKEQPQAGKCLVIPTQSKGRADYKFKW